MDLDYVEQSTGLTQDRELEKQMVGKNYNFNKINLINS